jgi:DNA-binding NarL/FixJ family response regulator
LLVGAGSTAGSQASTGAAGQGNQGNESGDGLYERETELAALASALAAARSGEGRLVVVEGPAGIGKSRLLAEARAMAAARGMMVLTARAIDLERDAPFGAVSDLFARILAGAAATTRDRLLSGQAALAASLFDPAAPAVADSSAVTRGLYWLTANMAAGPSGDGKAPGLLIAVDDAQWADHPSLAYLVHLSARIEELPVVLVMAVRSGEQATDQQAVDWLRDRSGSRLLRPRALSPDAIGQMVRAELPVAEPAFTDACAQVTDGNPFLARELLRALRADAIAPTAGSVSQVRSLVPDSVLRAVLVRLARLGEAAEQLAKAVAVLGNRAPMRQARLLAGLDPVRAEQAADALASANVLAADEPLRFTHPLIATSVYADIPAFARARAHRQAADLLTADGAPLDSIAAQLVATRPDGDQRTVAALREAAARALASGDPAAAGHLLTRALAEPPGRDERGQVLLEVANAEMEQGDMAAGEHIAEAISLASAPGERARALVALGRLHFNRGAHEAAAAAMEEALELLDPRDPVLPALLVGYLTATAFRAGLYPHGTARLEPMIEAARAGQPPQDAGLLAHLVLRLAFAAEPASRIKALAERATAADPLVDPASLGILNGLIVQALCCVDELDEAERISGLAIAAGRRRGSMLTFSMGSYHRAIARYHRGELASALADLEQSLVANREGWTAGDPWSGSLLVHLHLERGDLVAARGALAMTNVASPGSMDMSIVLHARARLALAEGHPDTALKDAEAAGQLLSDGFGIDHPGFLPWQRTASLAALALGDAGLARTRAGELLDRARWSGTARATGLALRTQAAISGREHGEQRRDLLAEAADVLAGSPSALERAHALIELGAACRRVGLPSAAQQPLREGLQLADGMGAAPLVRAARHELRALGLRPRRSAVTGPDSLTPTERRVAELAASGLTNRQTAEALFVTVKTVETHMVRVYQKLGISSRGELADIIGPAGS